MAIQQDSLRNESWLGQRFSHVIFLASNTKSFTDIYIILRSDVNGISSVSYEFLKEGIDRTQDLFPRKTQASAAGARNASMSEGLTLLQTSPWWRPSFAGAALTVSRVWGAHSSTTSLLHPLWVNPLHPSRNMGRESWYVQRASWIQSPKHCIEPGACKPSIVE